MSAVHVPAGSLLEGLAGRERRLLETAAEQARRDAVELLLVGGCVRDLLLGVETLDLDLVVVGDGPAFAERLAARLGGRARSHAAFLTARVELPSGGHLDVASARVESYRSGGELPEVRRASLEEDLARRDFTVNAIALRLAGGEEALIDPFGGRADLERGRLRVLHADSFRDDPTRILRGVRLELRLGLRFAAESERLARAAVDGGALATLSGDRLRRELQLALEETGEPGRLWSRLEELGVISAVGLPAAAVSAPRLERVSAVAAQRRWRSREREPRRWRLLLAAAVGPLDEAARTAVADRLALAGADRDLIVGSQRRLAGTLAELADADLPAHRAERLLGGLGDEELVLAAAFGGPAVEAWVERYLTELSSLRLAVGGDDLVRAGAEPGAAVGRALRATREARLDGRIGPAEELEFALEVLREGDR